MTDAVEEAVVALSEAVRILAGGMPGYRATAAKELVDRATRLILYGTGEPDVARD